MSSVRYVLNDSTISINCKLQIINLTLTSSILQRGILQYKSLFLNATLTLSLSYWLYATDQRNTTTVCTQETRTKADKTGGKENREEDRRKGMSIENPISHHFNYSVKH